MRFIAGTFCVLRIVMRSCHIFSPFLRGIVMTFFNTMLYVSLFFFPQVLYASQEQKEDVELQFAHKACNAALIAFPDAVVSTPLEFNKNKIQEARSKGLSLKMSALIAKENIKNSWRGTSTNAIMYAPVTLIQISTSDALGSNSSTSSQLQKIAAGSAGGVLSSLFVAPQNLIVRYQQKKQLTCDGKPETLQQTFARLYKLHKGNCVTRALWVTAGREAGFSAGLNALIPIFRHKIKRHTDNTYVIEVGAAVGSGVVTTVLTHPFDVLQAHLQEDISKNNYKNGLDAARLLFKQGGFRAFSSGIMPRMAMVTASLTVLSKAKEQLDDVTKKMISNK